MADLKQARKRLTIVFVALILADLVAVALLLTPLAGSQESRQQQMQQLWLQVKQREAAPWRGLDKKIPLATKQIDDFYRDRFSAEDSTISSDLGKIASGTGVRVSSVKYGQKDASIEGLQRVEVEADVSGDYLQLVRFINALERSKLFFIVDELQLGSEQAGIVKLQIKVETYLRSA